MDRQQILDCLNSGNISPEFIADWVSDKVPADKVGQVVSAIIQYGMTPPNMIPEMLVKYKINQVLSRIGEHIMWY